MMTLRRFWCPGGQGPSHANAGSVATASMWRKSSDRPVDQESHRGVQTTVSGVSKHGDRRSESPGMMGTLAIPEQPKGIRAGHGGPPATSRMDRSCLLYTSDAADDLLCVDLGGRRIIKKK